MVSDGLAWIASGPSQEKSSYLIDHDDNEQVVLMKIACFFRAWLVVHLKSQKKQDHIKCPTLNCCNMILYALWYPVKLVDTLLRDSQSLTLRIFDSLSYDKARTLLSE